MSNGAVEKLVRMAVQRVAGVDWEALARKGKRNVFESAYIYDYLIPAADRATAVMDTLAPIDVSQIKTREQVRAVSDALSAVDVRADQVVSAANAGNEVFAFDAESAITMPGVVFHSMIYGAYITALYGVVMHTDALMAKAAAYKIEKAAKTFRGSPAEFHDRVELPAYRAVADHADTCTRTLNVIAKLDEYGALAPFKKGRAASGLGALPIVGYVVIALVVVAIFVAYMAFATATTRERQREELDIIKEMCRDAQYKGDKAIQKKCLEVLDNPNKNIATAVSEIGKTLVLGVLALAGVGMAVNFAPAIVMRLRSARKATR